MAQRDPAGRFLPGSSGNPAGRPVVLAEVRAAAARSSLRSIATLELIRDDPDAPPMVRSAAADRLLQWAFGPPKAQVFDGSDAMLGMLSDQQLERVILEADPIEEEQPVSLLAGMIVRTPPPLED